MQKENLEKYPGFYLHFRVILSSFSSGCQAFFIFFISLW